MAIAKLKNKDLSDHKAEKKILAIAKQKNKDLSDHREKAEKARGFQAGRAG